MIRRLAIALALLSATGCVPTAVRRPSMRMIDPADREATFARALSVIQADGWIVAVSDRAAGLLTTQPMGGGYRSCGGLLPMQTRDTLQVSVGETGAVAVNLHRECLTNAIGGGPRRWFAVEAESAVVEVEREQAAFLRRIVTSSASLPSVSESRDR